MCPLFGMQFLVKKGMGMKVYKASKDVKKFLSRRSVYNEQLLTFLLTIFQQGIEVMRINLVRKMKEKNQVLISIGLL